MVALAAWLSRWRRSSPRSVRLSAEELGIYLANSGAPIPSDMNVREPVVYAAWARQWNAIVRQRHERGDRELRAIMDMRVRDPQRYEQMREAWYRGELVLED